MTTSSALSSSISTLVATRSTCKIATRGFAMLLISRVLESRFQDIKYSFLVFQERNCKIVLGLASNALKLWFLGL